MKDMSISGQTDTDFVTAYEHSLEQQIVTQGSSLACRDEELWRRVEVPLRDGDAREVHCRGLDPLAVMEESLNAAAPKKGSAARVKVRGGLQGLARAFEVVEQAALNLYFSPWREEYKVVKMYSGTFTHLIKPVLSVTQIEKLFGLLGYELNPTRPEQLCLQSSRLSPASPNNFLSLSCAFFLARCECRLLLTALGKCAGETRWELSLVRERQRGNSLQVALDNTRMMLGVNQPLIYGEVEMDLYTDEQINGGQRGTAAKDSESPRSATRITKSRTSPPAVRTHSNGVTSPPTAEDVHVSTLSYQLTQLSTLESNVARSSSASSKKDKRPCEESTSHTADAHSPSLQVEAAGRPETDRLFSCGCLQSPHAPLGHRIECNTLHNATYASLEHRSRASHLVAPTDEVDREARSTSQTLASSSAPAMSSLALCDDPEPATAPVHPIAFHDCCDLGQPDPQVLCFSCGVFHSSSCRDMDLCQGLHDIKPLGVCACGRACPRKPLVLCRYCGNEYCTDCWYRSPVVCNCGQTFDQSSSV